MHRNVFFGASAILAAMLASVPVATQAQAYPSRAIKLIVPSTPGSVADVLARAIAPDMGKVLGQSVVIENKAGADQVIGLEFVAKNAAADGYTLVISTVTSAAMLPVMKKGLRFDPLKDVPPFINLGESQVVMLTPMSRPWKTLDELTVQARANPGKLSYGASSPTVKLPMAAVLKDRGLNVIAVSYSQGSNFQMSLMGGEIDMGLLTYFNAFNFKDKLRALAISGETRNAGFPGVPTFKELGHPNVAGIAWSLNTRLGTPEPIIETLHNAAEQALKQPTMGNVFEKLGLGPMLTTRKAAIDRLADEGAFYAKVAPGVITE
jgi:tripartite-type tricarboxylate transporter receptor subunit TctC